MNVAALIRILGAKGMSADDIADVVELAMPAQPTREDRKRERDRVRVAEKRERESQESRDSGDIARQSDNLPLPPETEVSPTPPSRTQTTNPIQVPPIVPQIRSKSKPSKGSFAKFWAAYPLKVGKGKAEPAYCRAWGRCETDDPEGEMLTGLARCAPLWAADFIPYPATWLNRDGWLDQMVPDLPDAGGKTPIDLTKFDAERAAIRARIEAEEAAA